MWWARLLNVISGLLAGGVAASTTSYESIATLNLGGTTNGTFTSIPSTFKHLQIRGRWGTSGSMLIQFNSDTASNYSNHILYGDGSAAAADKELAVAYLRVGYQASDTYNVGGVVDILDYTSTNKNKTVRALSGWDNNGSGVIRLDSGLWFATPAAITSIKVYNATNFAANSTFALYGIKG
jgi:hypothetical protein